MCVTLGLAPGPAQSLAKRCGLPEWRHEALLMEFWILGPALLLAVHPQTNFFPSLLLCGMRNGLREHWHPFMFGICSASSAGSGLAGWL